MVESWYTDLGVRKMRMFSGAIALVVLAPLSGCSAYEDLRRSDFAEQDAARIVTAAEKAMKKVDRVRITGQAWLNGNSVFMDMHLSRQGNCKGTVRWKGRNLDIIRAGDRTWVKGDSGFVRMAVGDADVPQWALDEVSRTWVRIEDGSETKLCDLDKLLDEFTLVDHGGPKKQKKGADGSDEVDISQVTVGGEDELGDVTAVRLSASPGGAHDEHVWVASEAPHHVVRIESTETGDGGAFTLSEFDQKFEVVAPAGKDVVRV